MLHTSYIELSKEALNNNLRFLKNKAGKDVRYSMVIKANAYGHGIEEFLPMIEECGIDHFSVFSAVEAMRAWEAKRDECELMIMGWIDNDTIEWAIEHEVSFFVFTPERLQAALAGAKKCGKPARVHIELETGMHRTGFCEDQLVEVSRSLRENQAHFQLEGLCSHLAGAEDFSNRRRILNQIKTFNQLCSRFREKGHRPRYRHLACSAGLLNYPDSILDLVRIGISNYGFWPSDETRSMHLLPEDEMKDPLHRVLSWKSAVMSVNDVPEDEYVSYGDSYLTNRPTKIATVPVGYGYGYNRTLSNQGHVLINGKRVPVIGAVNMNMMTVDVTDLPRIAVGDEVVLIGSQGKHTITVSSFGDMNNSMNYELLTRLPHHIPRHCME